MLALGFIPTPLRIAIAAALVGVSFAAERYIYQGWCIIPEGEEFFRFFAFPTLFFVSFVWLTAEVAGRALSFIRLPRFVTWPAYVLVGLAIYLAAAGVVWQYNPTPEDENENQAFRGMMSFYWSAGILVETGNFSSFSCGH